ncbi:apolipoprotein L2-like [Ochotona curzoniae]|uniref:apolipoprotein L2-like n=1 Tax=Ochotona curzoniae TaxID=130825 RepID=UPI001B352736|nr:apolipoprotein L2-like [Ochotona curzoniae]
MESKEEDHGAAGSHEEDEQRGDGTMVPDDESRLADIIEYIRKALSREELQRLLAEDEAWGIFVRRAELSSEEAHALREALAKCSTGTAMDSVPDKDPDVDLEDEEERQVRERFLKAFPQVKAQLEESIAKLHALADKELLAGRTSLITRTLGAQHLGRVDQQGLPAVKMESKEEDHGTAGSHEEDEQGGDDTMVPDDESCFADIIEYIRKTLSSEELQRLLAEDEAWEIFVRGAELSSEEAHALREALLSYYTDTDTEPEDMEPEDKEPEDTEPEDGAHRREQQDRKKFLEEFPQVKAQLEEKIAKLHALADKVGKVHRDCTITNVVASSTGTVSGILSIAGLALAPVTAGVSLALTATGIGLGTAAAVTGLTSTLVDSGTRASAEEKASRITSSSVNQVELVAKAVGQSVPKILNVSRRFIEVLEDVGKNVHAINIAQANPRLLASAKQFMTAGKISARSTRQVQKAFGGTALAMTKGARIAGAATAGVFLLMDVVSLIQDSVHLHQGAPSELAQDLRQRAQQLEEKLAQLMEIYRSL